jgi:hypothetical protein
LFKRVDRVVLKRNCVQVTFARTSDNDRPTKPIEIPRPANATVRPDRALPPSTNRKVDQKLLQSIARAHAWLADLAGGRYSTIEELAAAAKLHPKVVRQGLRLAFLAPEIVGGILHGTELDLTLRQIPKALPLRWSQHQMTVGARLQVR